MNDNLETNKTIDDQKKSKNIRNFAIIAHIDHGKSTLSDRLIEVCGGIEMRDMKAQLLDSLDVEKQRGITVKAQAVSLQYKLNGEQYTLNLIDTPGHVDFSYEVKRSLKACEGAIVLVDASQGVQAQTIANIYKAIEEDLVLIPVLNKVDLPSSDPEGATAQVRDVLGIDEVPLQISAKTGLGVDKVIEKVIANVPDPLGDSEKELKALLVDGWFDQFLGVVLLVKIIDGQLKAGMHIRMMHTDASYSIDHVGVFTPKRKNLDVLKAGMVGFIIANIRTLSDVMLGDTVVEKSSLITEPLEGFQAVKPVVFCCIYPVDSSDYKILQVSLEKLKLHDGSLVIEHSNMPSLGAGFRCGFLGLLHLEVIQQRLEDEFDLNVIMTAPSVRYKITKVDGDVIYVNHPSEMPERNYIEKIEEPWVKVSIIINEEYTGPTMTLCDEKRGKQIGVDYLEGLNEHSKRCILNYRFPLSDIIFNFHDKLKSITKGYGSFEYEDDKYEEASIVPLSILVDGVTVEAIGSMIFKGNSEAYGRWVCQSLKESLDRQLFPIAIQAAIGGKIIARETVSALRKDVTAKCYGGDVSRKMKLLKKQKKGKKKMKEFMAGKVVVSQKAILKVLRRSQ
ncbi:elongation factor 4 [Candidatus Cytomitobacter indipagum]|uniref:Elongation factor 4 n=1 Tax=Candidatus Cytomitobacter indipagum TaxID=2601575 RepID=A0A5C0UG09_9PROT|nr:translation elongation factor 4 [Candidatus Cytomitobacter indipagum]QEK37974.1 elongation factor 4 [Candidatus Cytomitobacter indipagum]